MLVLCIACIAYEEFISSKLKWLYILGSCTHSIKLSKEINFVWILKQGVKNYLIFLNLIFLGRKICLCKHSCSIFDFVQCYSIWQLNKHIKLNWITQILKQYNWGFKILNFWHVFELSHSTWVKIVFKSHITFLKNDIIPM